MEVVQNHMDIVNGQFNPNEILDIVNGPLFDQAMRSNFDMITSKHVDSFLETYESSKVTEENPVRSVLRHHMTFETPTSQRCTICTCCNALGTSSWAQRAQ